MSTLEKCSKVNDEAKQRALIRATQQGDRVWTGGDQKEVYIIAPFLCTLTVFVDGGEEDPDRGLLLLQAADVQFFGMYILLCCNTAYHLFVGMHVTILNIRYINKTINRPSSHSFNY